MAPNSPCSLLSLSLWSCYTPPLQARPALPPMTGKPSSDRLVQVSGTEWTDGRGQRRTNNKGALLFSSSGWLGSPLRHEQDKPPPTSLAPLSLPHPLVRHVTTGVLQIAGQDYPPPYTHTRQGTNWWLLIFKINLLLCVRSDTSSMLKICHRKWCQPDNLKTLTLGEKMPQDWLNV